MYRRGESSQDQDLPLVCGTSREEHRAGLITPVPLVWVPDNLMKELRCGNAHWNFKGSDNLLCGNRSRQQVRTKPMKKNRF